MYYWIKRLSTKAGTEESCAVEHTWVTYRNTGAISFMLFNNGNTGILMAKIRTPLVVNDYDLLQCVTHDPHQTATVAHRLKILGL